MSAWMTYARAAIMLALGVGVAMTAHAGNTEHPRTPVLWPDAPCLQSVELGPGASFEFGYTIDAEDTQVSNDELEDSRTHQFVALCRQWPAGQPPPPYVSVADLERAIDAGLDDADVLLDDEATLETSPTWAGCWTRVTDDDARRPITFAAAAVPVTWAVEGAAAGTWMIAGYTWEPPLNMWRRAPWVVQVLDPAPAAPAQAAAALADSKDGIYPDETLALETCVAAEPGSTASLEWSLTSHDPPEWKLAESMALDGQTPVEFAFEPEAAIVGQTVFLRVAVEQPVGPAYVTHGLDRLVLFQGAGDGDGDGDGDPSAESESGSGTTSGSDAGTAETTGATMGAEGGSGCALAQGSHSRDLGAGGAVLWFLLVYRRSRRRALELT